MLQIYCVKHKLNFSENPKYEFFTDVKEFTTRVEFLKTLESVETLSCFDGELNLTYSKTNKK